MTNLGFGCMRLPLLDGRDQSAVDTALFNTLVDTFLEKGFFYFDTALTYHGFKSEEFVKKALVNRHDRSDFLLATKLPPRMLKRKEDQEQIFNEQLEKCGVDFFDYYLLHNIGVSAYEKACKYDSFGFLQEKKNRGKLSRPAFPFTIPRNCWTQFWRPIRSWILSSFRSITLTGKILPSNPGNAMRSHKSTTCLSSLWSRVRAETWSWSTKKQRH
jgi:hypothetical protein